MRQTDSRPESATRLLNRSVVRPTSAAGFAWIGLFNPVADSGPESAFYAIKRNLTGAVHSVVVHSVAGSAKIRTASDPVQAAPSHNPQRKQGFS